MNSNLKGSIELSFVLISALYSPNFGIISLLHDLNNRRKIGNNLKVLEGYVIQ